MSDRPTTEDFYRGEGAASSSGAAGRGTSPTATVDSTGSTSGDSSGGSTATDASTGSVSGAATAGASGGYAGSRSAPSARSAGQLMKEITEDLSSLFRKEIELAKQEIGGSVKVKAKGAAIIAIAGFFGLLALQFLLLAIRDGFDTFLWTWVADIATALVLLLIGAVAALVARKKLQTPIAADLTKQTVKEDIEWAKSIGKR
ncbi:hypothetical protein BH24ACT26_BH24ACT26_19530 [soil metagenome]